MTPIFLSLDHHLELVRLAVHGVKQFKSGTIQQNFDNQPGAKHSSVERDGFVQETPFYHGEQTEDMSSYLSVQLEILMLKFPLENNFLNPKL